MDDKIIVHVLGPRLMAQSLCALLNGFPDICAVELVSHVSPKDGIGAERAGVLLVILPVVGPDMRRGSCLEFRRFATDTSQPARLLLPDGFLAFHVALITSGTENDIAAGCASGIRIFLSIEDEVHLLRQGVMAGACGEPFCSPKLTRQLVEALQRRTREVAEMQEGRGFDRLSRREKQVAELAAAGLSNAEIAGQLFVEDTTIKAHLTVVFRKLQIRRRSQIRQFMS